MSQATAGHRAGVKIGGISTPMSDEPCSALSATVYQVTNAARRVLDRSVAVVVEADGVVVDPGDYSLDHLFGVVEFASAPATPVTVTASYLPLLTLIKSREFTLDLNAQNQESTCFGQGAVARDSTLFDLSVTINRLELGFDDLGDTTNVVDLLLAGQPIVLELAPETGQAVFRLWALIASKSVPSSPNDLVSSVLGFVGDDLSGTKLFSYRAP
jgi:hypothetical protein